jgi:hypothetical protein
MSPLNDVIRGRTPVSVHWLGPPLREQHACEVIVHVENLTDSERAKVYAVECVRKFADKADSHREPGVFLPSFYPVVNTASAGAALRTDEPDLVLGF